jgi:hypothetical protein
MTIKNEKKYIRDCNKVNYFAEHDVDGRMILKIFVAKSNVLMWIRFNWIRTGQC